MKIIICNSCGKEADESKTCPKCGKPLIDPIIYDSEIVPITGQERGKQLLMMASQVMSDTVSDIASRGDPCAMIVEAASYPKLSNDKNKAINYLKRAAELGWPEALHGLWDLYRKEDKKKASEYLTLAADNGVAEAQYDIGMDLIKENAFNEKGLQYLKMASDQGHDQASLAYWATMVRMKTADRPSCILGLESLIEKIENYGTSLSDGSKMTLYRISAICRLQNDKHYNMEKAFRYAKKAAGMGDAECNYICFEFLSNNSESQASPDEVYGYLAAAALAGHSEASRGIKAIDQILRDYGKTLSDFKTFRELVECLRK